MCHLANNHTLCSMCHLANDQVSAPRALGWQSRAVQAQLAAPGRYKVRGQAARPCHTQQPQLVPGTASPCWPHQEHREAATTQAMPNTPQILVWTAAQEEAPRGCPKGASTEQETGHTANLYGSSSFWGLALAVECRATRKGKWYWIIWALDCALHGLCQQLAGTQLSAAGSSAPRSEQILILTTFKVHYSLLPQLSLLCEERI